MTVENPTENVKNTLIILTLDEDRRSVIVTHPDGRVQIINRENILSKDTENISFLVDGSLRTLVYDDIVQDALKTLANVAVIALSEFQIGDQDLFIVDLKLDSPVKKLGKDQFYEDDFMNAFAILNSKGWSARECAAFYLEKSEQVFLARALGTYNQIEGEYNRVFQLLMEEIKKYSPGRLSHKWKK